MRYLPIVALASILISGCGPDDDLPPGTHHATVGWVGMEATSVNYNPSEEKFNGYMNEFKVKVTSMGGALAGVPVVDSRFDRSLRCFVSKVGERLDRSRPADPARIQGDPIGIVIQSSSDAPATLAGRIQSPPLMALNERPRGGLSMPRL